jgi:hypothetical protein
LKFRQPRGSRPSDNPGAGVFTRATRRDSMALKLKRLGSTAFDLDSVVLIQKDGDQAVVTFSGGASATFTGDEAVWLKAFVAGLPDATAPVPSGFVVLDGSDFTSLDR